MESNGIEWNRMESHGGVGEGCRVESSGSGIEQVGVDSNGIEWARLE